MLAVPLLYGGIQAIEMSAILARIAGLRVSKSMSGYALQQSVYMATRLLLVMLLPLLGLAIDSGIDKDRYAVMVHASLAVSFIAGAAVILLRKSIIRYYSGVLLRHDQSGNYISSFFSLSNTAVSEGVDLRIGAGGRIFFFSVIVFTIYSSGMFLSFYLAALIPEYRASISQSSGVINALGALLLTFVIEPKISRSIDKASADATDLIFALLIGRWFAVSVVAQILLIIVFWIV
ncbi:hypothetical protein AM2010_2186 [Pelagerythrobacter marensis]|uniref:Uncharacterized protein n=2 Tax=Pelagerythrobacter marensis TaxID=543877 RepID=A0A0G3X9M1_9SPHN|nr:hypothetical protein AM2010_2186 [Pelagerythrobacter marensis]